MTMTTEQTPAVPLLSDELIKCLRRVDGTGTVILMEANEIRRAASMAKELEAARAMPTPESAEPVAWPAVDYKTIPDDEPAPLVLAYLRACALSWEPGVRILGNLRSSDLVRVLNELEIAHPPKAEQPRVVLTDEEIERLSANEYPVWKDQDGVHDLNEDKREKFADGLRYARDHYGIGAPAGFTPSDK